MIIMDLLQWILHFDKHLAYIIQNFGLWSYVILFAIIFAETGLVVTPFLPGDSMLFAVGAFAALGSLNITWVLVILMIAAILGDTVNYSIGKFFGHAICNKGWVKQEYIAKTHQFYEKYGAKTIVIARFVPIVRTFAPFVAGIGSMSYLKFATYNIVGGIMWVAICVFGGYFFGNMPFVKEHFSLVVIGIIFVSILPGIIEVIRHKMSKKGPSAPSLTKQADI